MNQNTEAIMKIRRTTRLMIIVLTVVGLVVTISAIGVGSLTDTPAACCCSSGESCPMKTKDIASAKKASAIDHKCGCCTAGSCSMKKTAAAANDPVKDSAMSCDKCACCKGGACSMKKGDHHESTKTNTNHPDKAHDPGKACCSCCHKDSGAEKKNVAV